jgi:diaminopimelate epimerase
MLGFHLLKDGWKNLESFNEDNICQYPSINGYRRFRETLGNFLQIEYQKPVNPDELFITDGVSGAIQNLYKLFGGNKVKVFIENPTYFLILKLFRDFNYDCEFVKINVEPDGADIDFLQSELYKLKDDEKAIFYTIPTFHNPTSFTMSVEKRFKLGQIANDWKDKLLILADEVYQMLYFEDVDKPPLPLCYFSDQIVSIGSFSKIMYPSTRVGWIQTKNTTVYKKLMESGYYDSAGGVSSVTLLLIEYAINSGGLTKHILSCRRFLKINCDGLCRELKIEPYGQFIKPKGGYFIWIKFNEWIDTRKMQEYSDIYLVNFHSGVKFSPDGSNYNFMRLSFSVYSYDQLGVAGKRLSKLVDDFFQTIDHDEKKIMVHLVGYRGRQGGKIMKHLESNKIFFNTIDRDMNFNILSKYKNIVLDMSSPDGTLNIIKKLRLINQYIPLIIGTTGDLPMSQIQGYSHYAPVLLASNFSFGIPIICEWLKTIDTGVWKASFKDIHHCLKKDKPSGTAKRLKQCLKNSDDLEIVSIREGEVIGTHIILLKTPHEYIEIVHTATDPDIFASGCIRYISWLINKHPSIYTESDYYHEQHKDTSKIRYEKYTGSGNDFIIIHQDDIISQIPKSEWNKYAKKLCQRGVNIGGDGLIIIDTSKSYGIDGYVYWYYFNADGSMVEMCGNGSRCVSHWVSTHLKKNTGVIRNNFEISQSFSVNKNQVIVQIPEPVHILDQIAIREYKYSHIIIGVPHLVTVVESFDILSRDFTNDVYCESKHYFEDININWIQCTIPIIPDEIIRIRTRERGSGYTLACGTGCCAAAIHLLQGKIYPNNKYVLKFQTDSGEIIKVIISREETITGDKLICYLEGEVRLLTSGKIEQ